MLKTLMNKDRPVLNIDLEEPYIEVLDEDFLPFDLQGGIETTGTDIKRALKDIDTVKDYLSSRTLSLERGNAKTILNVTQLPQSMKISDKLKIVYACKGLSMTDSFWLRDDGEKTAFRDVNIRSNKLSDVSYEIAILGKHVSATAEELRPDLSTHGMFPKYWHREDGTVFLYKTDMFTGNPNTRAEVLASKILEEAGVDAVHYHGEEKDGRFFSVCRCIADDKWSLVSISSIYDWCSHNDIAPEEVIQPFRENFGNMVICDYVTANTDRNIDNWGFLVENETNTIRRFAPLYDLNQSLIADEFGTDIDELIYEPTKKPFIDSVKEYAHYSTVSFKENILPPKCLERWDKVKQLSITRHKGIGIDD